MTRVLVVKRELSWVEKAGHIVTGVGCRGLAGDRQYQQSGA